MMLLDEYVVFMIDGMGSPNIVSILKILEVEGKDGREDILKKVLYYVINAVIERSRERATRTISSKNKTIAGTQKHGK